MNTAQREQNDEGYRQLAGAVLRQAVDDVLMQGPAPDLPDEATGTSGPERAEFVQEARRAAQAGAVEFLFSAAQARGRAFWLGWLHMTERDLWNTLAKPVLRGCTNKLHRILRPNLITVGALHAS